MLAHSRARQWLLRKSMARPFAASLLRRGCRSDARVVRALPPSKFGAMAATYEPATVEQDWYAWWETSGLFQNDESPHPDAKTFSMVIPPPNVTGALHIGHATTVAIQDALLRWRRMNGDDSLYVPGVDHAGIATQSVVEKQLVRSEGKTRHDYGRDAFVAKVWEWYDSYNSRIQDQLRRLAGSLDWRHEVFTLDEPRSHAVATAFVSLHDEGLIYRQRRMVNWCPHLRTAISDIEVDHKDVCDAEWVPPGETEAVRFGVLHHFDYPVEGGESLTVATTRLETMLGDAAVAVHPDDPRYQHLIGKFATHPVDGRRIPIVADPELVDMELGTGAVKVTPAHDPNDLLCGRRHNLPEVSIFSDTGVLTDAVAPEYVGLTRFQARTKLVEQLTELGLYRGCEPHTMALGVCSRSGDILEPMLKPQWFVRCDEMAAKSVDLVRSGEMVIRPESYETEWYRWLENIQDWCISRQLWWGHRVPAYRIKWRGSFVPDEEMSGDWLWVAALSESQALERARLLLVERGECTLEELDATPEALEVDQDDDVLDTWFSSGLFPLSVLGWPHDSSLVGDKPVLNLDPDMSRYYPLSIMETGADILFFWVARMSMLCTHFTGVPPFKEVCLHPVVRDKSGRKMSKSLGNVIDPLHLINGVSIEAMLAELQAGNLPPAEVDRASKELKQEFPEGIRACGCDALRLTLTAAQTGHRVHIDPQKVVMNRLFCNKMWNAVRYTLSHFETKGRPSWPADLGDLLKQLEHSGAPPLSTADRWILSRLAQAAQSVETGYETFHIGAVAQAVHRLFLTELCDVYLEWSKGDLNSADTKPERVAAVLSVLAVVMDGSLRLFHPLMPFITEELYQRLASTGLEGTHGTGAVSSIVEQPFPSPTSVSMFLDPKAEADMAVLLGAVKAGRSLRKTATDILGKARKDVLYVEASDDVSSLIEAHQSDLQRQAGVQSLVVVDEAVSGCLEMQAAPGVTVYCPVAGDENQRGRLREEIKRLEKKRKKVQKQAAGLRKRVEDPKFLANVPDNVRETQQARLKAIEGDIDAIMQSIRSLNAALESTM